MNSITKDYLAEIIFKKISETIDQYREKKQHQFDNEPYPGATDEEVLDFILSIPYFDNKLKDFLLGNLAEETIIISQAWEIEFIKKTMLWRDSFEWLHGRGDLMTGLTPGKTEVFLRLPY
ncbi:MAG: hypothetical protein H7211_10785 [Aquabacterium sp.]|nr:hypothetical protein [Ferruginibacter sp.]